MGTEDGSPVEEQQLRGGEGEEEVDREELNEMQPQHQANGPNHGQTEIANENQNCPEEIVQIRNRLLEVMNHQGPREQLASLKICDKWQLKMEVEKVNQAVKLIKTQSVTKLNNLLYAGAYVITERLGRMV